MRISTAQVDRRPVVPPELCGFTWPVLEDGNHSYINGAYRIDIADKSSDEIEITHKVLGAPLLRELIKKNLALFACAVASPSSAYRKIFFSNFSSTQTIKLEKDKWNSAPQLIPVLLSAEDQEIILDAAQHQLHERWDNKRITMAKGSRLAIGHKTRHSKPGIHPLRCDMQLDSLAFRNLRVKLLTKRGAAFQREFIQSALDNDTFVSFFRNNTNFTGETAIRTLRSRLTEDEYTNMPSCIEESIFDLYKNIPLGIASTGEFWGYVTLQHIIGKIINSSYLAQHKRLSGREYIEFALAQQDDDVIDNCVRTILRRLSGLANARGNRSVFSNCCFGRAFWRQHMLEKVSALYPYISRGMICEVLMTGQSYWEQLISRLMVSSKTKFGSELIFAAFVASLADRWYRSGFALRTAANLAYACRYLNSIVATRELSILKPHQLKSVTDELTTVNTNLFC